MKKTAAVVGISLLTLLMVLPVFGVVKQFAIHHSANHSSLVADGGPLPNPYPNPW